MGSVGFLFRLGIAIEKIGKRIAKNSGGRKVHPHSHGNFGLSNTSEVVRNLNQGYARNGVMDVALGQEVNENCGLAVVKNVELLGSQLNCAGLSQKNSPS